MIITLVRNIVNDSFFSNHKWIIICHHITYQGQTYRDAFVDIHKAKDVKDVEIFLVDAYGEYFPR